MGTIRNGARTFLNLLAKACKMSHLPGFRSGVATILDSEQATVVFGLWDPLCLYVEGLIAADNWYNQKDFLEDDFGGEDTGTPA